MYGGKKVRETLVWEEVLFFCTQFVLGSAKDLISKPQKTLSPTHKKASYGMYGGKKARRHSGLGGSAVFLPSVCAWVSKEIKIQNLEKL